jgi:hypothetical protein
MTPMQQDQQNQPVRPPPPGQKPTMSPRANGALLVGAGLGIEGLNGAFLMNDGTFYPKLLIIGAALVPLGIWTLATGIAYDKNSGVKPPTWWTVGAVVLTMGGVGLGIFVSEWLKRN